MAYESMSQEAMEGGREGDALRSIKRAHDDVARFLHSNEYLPEYESPPILTQIYKLWGDGRQDSEVTMVGDSPDISHGYRIGMYYKFFVTKNDGSTEIFWGLAEFDLQPVEVSVSEMITDIEWKYGFLNATWGYNLPLDIYTPFDENGVWQALTHDSVPTPTDTTTYYRQHDISYDGRTKVAVDTIKSGMEAVWDVFSLGAALPASFVIYNLWFETDITVETELVNGRIHWGDTNVPGAPVYYYWQFTYNRLENIYTQVTPWGSGGSSAGRFDESGKHWYFTNTTTAIINQYFHDLIFRDREYAATGTEGGNPTYTLYYTNNTNWCFPRDTPITTNQGIIPIQKINTDIHTINDNKIICITKTITSGKYLVCFEKDALGLNCPTQKTIMSAYHGIYYNGKMKMAKRFLGDNIKIYKIKYNGELLYNVLMAKHDKINVNNLICETLHPKNRTTIAIY